MISVNVDCGHLPNWVGSSTWHLICVSSSVCYTANEALKTFCPHSFRSHSSADSLLLPHLLLFFFPFVSLIQKVKVLAAHTHTLWAMPKAHSVQLLISQGNGGMTSPYYLLRAHGKTGGGVRQRGGWRDKWGETEGEENKWQNGVQEKDRTKDKGKKEEKKGDGGKKNKIRRQVLRCVKMKPVSRRNDEWIVFSFPHTSEVLELLLSLAVSPTLAQKYTRHTKHGMH